MLKQFVTILMLILTSSSFAGNHTGIEGETGNHPTGLTAQEVDSVIDTLASTPLGKMKTALPRIPKKQLEDVTLTDAQIKRLGELVDSSYAVDRSDWIQNVYTDGHRGTVIKVLGESNTSCKDGVPAPEQATVRKIIAANFSRESDQSMKWTSAHQLCFHNWISVGAVETIEACKFLYENRTPFSAYDSQVHRANDRAAALRSIGIAGGIDALNYLTDPKVLEKEMGLNDWNVSAKYNLAEAIGFICGAPMKDTYPDFEAKDLSVKVCTSEIVKRDMALEDPKLREVCLSKGIDTLRALKIGVSDKYDVIRQPLIQHIQRLAK